MKELLKRENKTKQNSFDATQKRSEPETLLLRYCKFLIQILVRM